MVNLFNYLLIFNIFGGGFILFSVPFEFYIGYLFIIVFLVVYFIRFRRIAVNPLFLISLTILMEFSYVNIYFENVTFLLIARQVLGILVTGAAYYLLIKINRYDIDKLFRIYLKFALLAAAIGIFQEFSFLIKFKHGYDFSYVIPKWYLDMAGLGMPRLNSIFPEPAHFAIAMAPAFFVSLLNILRKEFPYQSTKLWSLMIIISYVMTFSAVAYIGILISSLLIVNFRRYKYLLLWAVVMLTLFYAAYRYVPEIRLRVKDAIEVGTGSKKAVNSNMSVYSIASNAFVAYKSFVRNPLFGSGLGSHPVSYDEFVQSGGLRGFWGHGKPVANAKDGSSLFVRLVSETGLIGLVMVFYFIFKFRLKISDYKKFEIINSAILILFVLQLIRQGHYFYNGLFFFVWMYYFSYKISNDSAIQAKRE